jgi:hypothetical protein
MVRGLGSDDPRELTTGAEFPTRTRTESDGPRRGGRTIHVCAGVAAFTNGVGVAGRSTCAQGWRLSPTAPGSRPRMDSRERSRQEERL